MFLLVRPFGGRQASFSVMKVNGINISAALEIDSFRCVSPRRVMLRHIQPLKLYLFDKGE
ncbi:hypothetical protein [Sulfitobacter donghicola]|uniref:hypothetical protein n=1 Tax=Sulfitobacter donghicola TaxID=421000 RepID=UPI00138E346B|nr:hypothetical protein [Sulfitobacter donghicola]